MELAWFAIIVSILAFEGAVLVHGQPDWTLDGTCDFFVPGFLSIDCGIAEDSYTDDNTKIFYTSDAKFIDTGINKDISKDYISDEQLPRQYHNLRSFPEGPRNCYTLKPVIKSNRYLLRASFLYGNYDGLNKTPQFDVYVGVNRWDVRLPSTAGKRVRNEIIMYTTMEYISVCLANTGNGIPFISGLELRHLNNSTYEAANVSQSVRLYGRYNFRSNSSGPIRFPDDVYDRIWSPRGANPWISINTSSPINLREDLGYQPPLPVMNTAVMPSNISDSLSFYFPTADRVDPRLQYHLFMHFAELRQLRRNESREFYFSTDGEYAYGPFSPSYLSVTTIFTASPLSDLDYHLIDLRKTTSSTLPPILNAVEIFILEPFSTTPTDTKDVDAIIKVKARYQIKRNWIGDPCVPVNYSWDGLNCSYMDSNPPTIISLDLSSSGLTGELATSLANLTSIQSLDVSNNILTGPVPDFLTELSSLKILNLSNNQFTGSIPTILLEKSKDGSLLLSFDNNTNLVNNIIQCKADSCKKRRQFVVPLLASVILALLMLIIVVFALWKFRQRKRQRDPFVRVNKAERSTLQKQYRRNGSLRSENRQFTYAQVINMTNNFERAIGNGGFGTVYHGQMRDGTQVAVKMLSSQSVKFLSQPHQGSDEFHNEAQLLMRVRHRNLVPFIGYCQEGKNMALIYEYMAQGNLGSHLSGTNSNSEALNWGQRLRIALDVAQGLEYLHNGCKPAIIHRDMKTTNILLNERLEAKIGDFGMSKVFRKDDELTHVSTAVKGTHGYLDPEYCISNNLTEKSDVYSFGIVLLELITGQPAVLRISDSENRSIIDWVRSIVAAGGIRRLVDPRMEDKFDLNSVWKVVEIALACTPSRSIERPTMSYVVAELKDSLGANAAIERSRSFNIEPVDTTYGISFYPSAR